MEPLHETISRRRFVALGAASGAVASGLLGGVAHAIPAQDGDGSIEAGGDFTSAAPVVVNRTVMNSKGVMDFVAIGQNGGNVLRTNAGGTAVYNNDGVGTILTQLDMPPGSVLKQVDVYGLRTASGDQVWNLKKVDVTATTAASLIQTKTVSGNGATQASFTGLDQKVGGVERLYVELQPNGADNLAVGVVYQYVPPTTGLVLFGDDTDTNGDGRGDATGGPIAPVRVYDSRYDSRGKLLKGQTRIVSVANEVAHRGGRANVVPAGARAIAYNITVTGTEGTFGFLSVSPAQVPPTFEPSSINWDHANGTIANGLIVAISPNREIGVLCDGDAAAVKTHFIVDVTGYFI